jgi:cell division protein FtsZ
VTALGGGVGSGVTPEVVKYLKETKRKSKVIVIMPFSFEGKKRQQTAMKSLELIRHYTNNIVLIRNDDCLVKGSKQGFTESLATISKKVYRKIA